MRRAFFVCRWLPKPLFFTDENAMITQRTLAIVILSAALPHLVCCSGESPSRTTQFSDSTATLSVATAPTEQPLRAQAYLLKEYRSGGAASIARVDENAFSQSPQAITKKLNDDAVFKQGNFLFRSAHGGEGPLLNNPTCQGCHVKDGRGNPPINTQEAFTSMLVRLSLGNDSTGTPIPDPIYGTQLQTFGLTAEGNLLPASYGGALDGLTVSGEAHAFIEYREISGVYGDGSRYTLRQPTYYLKNPAYGDFADGLLMSARVASPMIGLGLLGAIPEGTIVSLADPNDENEDGISGRPRYIVNNTTHTQQLGRFGWKASTGSVLQQSAGAYRGDMGHSNSFNPQEPCTAAQLSCLAFAKSESQAGNAVDVSNLELAFVEFYARLLAVPERRGFDVVSQTWEPDIVAGRDLFESTGCAACHVPHHKTGAAVASVLGVVEGLSVLVKSEEPIAVLTDQHIWPYTDLLLHDMGGSCEAVTRQNQVGAGCTEGENCYWVQRCEGLADGRPDGDATGSEWRTPPLWGLGLVKTVNPKAGFLHDGRARTIEEAILWHGGEGAASQHSFTRLSAVERQQLLAYLHSL